MGIPETQFDTWAHQGSIAQSSETYNRIKGVLEAQGTPYADKNIKVFLQGSYGNDTNIWSESDVDVVIKLNDCFHHDLSSLSEPEKAAFKQYFNDAAYTHVDFKRDVVQVLSDAYGQDIAVGAKAVAIAARGNRRKADVIVATQFRRYQKFNGGLDQTYTEGICFWNSAGQRIANYPKQHSDNLTLKHQATNARLKPMVRIFKNLRSRCVSDGILTSGAAPSYYLEGLLYNVPSSKFVNSYRDTFANVINWLEQEADKDKLVCANEQYYLLRDGEHTCWPKKDGQAFLDAAVRLWNSW